MSTFDLGFGECEERLTGLFMNLRVNSKASGERVAEKIPTCTESRLVGQDQEMQKACSKHQQHTRRA